MDDELRRLGVPLDLLPYGYLFAGPPDEIPVRIPYPVDGPHIGMLPLAKAKPAADAYRAVLEQVEVSPDSSESALAFGPGRYRIPGEQGREGRIVVGAIRRPSRVMMRNPSEIGCAQLSVLPDRLCFVTSGALAAGGGHARYTFRLRLSSTAIRALEAEWAR
ncbi:hypothetical protein ACH4F5_49765, partial [Streptomyces sp. NPDC017964]